MSSCVSLFYLLDSRDKTVFSINPTSTLNFFSLLYELFVTYLLFILKLLIMKRQYRDLRDDTKMRISQSLKGRSHSETHKQAISNAMKAYWATIPYRDEDNNESNNQNDETSV
jgi:hypothetical protein